MPDLSFTKKERLSSRKSISSLFLTGRKVNASPLRIIYSVVETGQFPAAVAVSVPKRLFKRAVDRNLLKRRIREAYRLNKPGFYERLTKLDKQIHLLIQFQHSDIADYLTIEEGLIRGYNILFQQLQNSSE